MKKLFPFLALSLGLIASANAQAPANDNCANAIALTVDAACVNGTNKGAATEISFESNYGQDVWYKFTATSAFTKISLTNVGDSLDAVVFVVENGCTDPINNELLRVDNTFDGGLDEIGSLATMVGTEYHIAIQGFVPQSKFADVFCIAVSETVEPPSNDEPDNVPTLTSGACTNYTTVGATTSAATGGLIPSSYTNDVFFVFMATKDSATISLTNVGPNLDAAIFAVAIFNGGDSAAVVGVADDGLTGGLDETLTFATQKDSIYFIVVAGYKTTNEDVFCIALTEKNVSSLNDLSGIEVFTVFPNPTNGSINLFSGSNTSIDAVVVSDISGRSVLQTELTNSNQTIATNNLSEGVYLIQLFNKGSLVGRSRFVKQ